MSNTEANKSLTVVLNDKDNVHSSQQTTSERYIIDTNKQLQKENTRLKITVNTLESTVDELEEDLSAEEKRNQYLKSLLKNFHEIHKNMIKLNSVEYDLNNKTYQIIAEIIPIIILLTSIVFCRLWYIAPFFIPVGAIGFRIRYNKLTSELYILKSELENNIKEIESGQDYIYEFIENC